jgi:hypothetical protein
LYLFSKEFALRVSILLATTSLNIFLLVTCVNAFAAKAKTRDISHLITKQEFLQYSNVADFIDKSPQVTINVTPSEQEIAQYGPHMKSLTGSDCDRDGKMDDNASCNAVFYKLWLKYAK